MLPDMEIRVARFLSLPLATIQAPHRDLVLPAYTGPQLRRITEMDRDRLSPAIHAAVQVASAVVRSLRSPALPVNLPPSSGLAWRTLLSPQGRVVNLDHLLSDLWARGIPVVPVDHLPVPNFQGLACIVENRPVILLGQRYDELGRVAFLVTHETGHITNRDCSPDQIVVDAEDEVQDDIDIEKKADQYGVEVLAGCSTVPVLASSDFKSLASEASRLERAQGIDAGLLISSWARRTIDYKTATMAVKALYRSTGGRSLLREHFDRHVDLEGASESDRTLLQCVYQDPAFDESAH